MRLPGQPRAPVTGVAEIAPVVLLDGGAAVRGDVSRIELAPDKWQQPEGVGAVILPGTTGTLLRLRWSYDALVIGLTMGLRNIDPADPLGMIAYSAIGVRVTITGGRSDDLFLVGQSGGFVDCNTIAPLAACCSVPIYRLARESDVWTVQFENHSPALSVAPVITFAARLLELSCPPEPTEVAQAR